MELLLLHFSNLVLPDSAMVNHTIVGSAISSKLGYIVLGIILGPVFLLTVTSLIEAPRNSRIPALFIGAFTLLFGGMVVGLGVIGLLLKFVIPQ